MNKNIQNILQALDAYEKTPDSYGMDLRLSLADTILKHLREKNWTQSTLAEMADLQEPFVSKVIHSNANCTFETAGKILWALGIRARLAELREPESACFVKASASDELSQVWHNFMESPLNGTEENDEEEARQGSTQTSVEFQGVGEAYRNL